MRLFWRIYLTLLASLALVAILGGAAWRLIEEPIPRPALELAGRLAGAALPVPSAPEGEQQAALERIAEAVRGDLTLYAADGRAIAAVGRPVQPPPPREARGVFRRGHPPLFDVMLPDGRRLLVHFPHPPREPIWRLVRTLGAVVIAVGLAAFPVVRRLTRRLDRLREGAAAWGGGALSARIPVDGRDEVAAVARTFNEAAASIERLMESHKTLLANASHELRSPLARLRMGIEMYEAAPTESLKAELARNLGELDTLVEEILLASRLDRIDRLDQRETIDLLALAAEVAAQTGGTVEGASVDIDGDRRLLHRLVRNLLENANKHGRPPVRVEVGAGPRGDARLVVHDSGMIRDASRVFEPFYRGEGASESAGGWGLGLALVRQIAERHGGTARCESGPGRGTAFIVELPAAQRAAPATHS